MKSMSLSLSVIAVVLGVGAAHASNVVTVEAGPIRTARDAGPVCQGLEATARWTGQWVTTEWGQMSVCGCEVGSAVRSRFDVEAGPIWSNVHAQDVCPAVCSDARWTGAYAKRSGFGVCALDYPGQIRGRVKVGGPTLALTTIVRPARPHPVVMTEIRGPRVYKARPVATRYALR